MLLGVSQSSAAGRFDAMRLMRTKSIRASRFERSQGGSVCHAIEGEHRPSSACTGHDNDWRLWACWEECVAERAGPLANKRRIGFALLCAWALLSLTHTNPTTTTDNRQAQRSACHAAQAASQPAGGRLGRQAKAWIDRICRCVLGEGEVRAHIWGGNAGKRDAGSGALTHSHAHAGPRPSSHAHRQQQQHQRWWTSIPQLCMGTWHG